MFPGLGGVVVIVVVALILFLLNYRGKKGINFVLDPKNEKGAFEPFLTKYLHLSEFMIGLASGSIVLLVGSSVFHGQGGKLPWFYASPLLLLASSVLGGLAFMAWLILGYEEYSHGSPHTGLKYAISLTLGLAPIVYFCFGYFWLIVAVTR